MRRRASLVFTVAKYATGTMAAGWVVVQHNWSAMAAVAAGTFALLLALNALEALDFLSKAVDGPERTATRIPRRTAENFLLRFSALLAGRRRLHLRDEWSAVLADAPLSFRRRHRVAAGFVRAAVCMRLRDLTRSGWRPVNWLLRSQDRTNAAITLIVGALVVYFAMVDGVHELLAERGEACAGLGAYLYLLAKWTRRRRGIEAAAQPRNRADD